MPHVLSVTGTGVEVFVLTRDHCPPHLHCENAADGWEAKLEFSYLNNDVRLAQLYVSGKRPRVSTLNTVLAAVIGSIKRCRDEWWSIYGDTCLKNQRLASTPAGLAVAPKRHKKSTVQVTAASYSPSTGKTTIHLGDGSVLQAL